MPNAVIAAVILAIAAIACVTDVRTRKIPNVLTFGTTLAALLVHLVTGGAHGAATALGGWLLGTALFLPFFLLRGMGAGDVKLLAALGAWLGPRDVVWLGIYSSILGGALAVGVSLARGYLPAAMRNVGGLLSYWSAVGFRPAPDLTLDSRAPRLAYGIPILAGTAVTLWLR